ncbi:hypothetical protein [Algiphilus aromaticivorans]|uniref:hypothetical protein n=1 Tax=Algiphilus aromaticivorans TaxID=382454 RepID=UPI0012EB23A3|nr:hypothetical protein [Algiphilus aromaticivorans]
MTRYSPYFLMSGVCALTLLAGCDAVGDGVAPTGLTFEPNFQATGLTAREAEEAQEAFENGEPFRITECIPAQARTVLEFDNGARENATQRSENIRYSSSDESVLEVSNFDIPLTVNPDQPFPRGTLIPRSPGTATVTVNFSNFETSMEVEVQPLGEIEPFVDFPRALAPNAFAEVVANAEVNGQTLSVSNAAALKLTDVNSGDPSEAVRSDRTADGRVFVRGLLPAVDQQAELDFALCDRQFTQEFDVAEISELQLARAEDDGEPAVIGFSELLEATAVFADGSEQRLSEQVSFSRPEEEDNLLLLLNTQTRGNSLLLPLSGSEGDDPDEGEISGTGGVGTLNASFDQDASSSLPTTELPDGVTDLPEVEATPLEIPVRPGRAAALHWRVEANDEGERVLELPQGCETQPGVEADIQIFRGSDDYVTVTRDVTRSVNYLVGDESLDEEEDEADTAQDEEEESEPVINVVRSGTLSSQLRAGTITAVGEVGEEERLRAVLVQSGTIPGFDEPAEGEERRIEDEILVRVVERQDCAPFDDPGVLE